MKNIIFRTMAIVLAFGIAACSRTDETANNPSDQKITELGILAQNTRSTLGEDNWVEWDANDTFSVFSSMSFSSQFSIKELADDKHSAKLSGEAFTADTYYVLYPYIMDAMIAEGKIHAKNIISPTQPLIENTFDHKQNPAVGHTSDNIAPMKNIAGLVKIHVTGKIDLRRITLQCNTSKDLIAGTGTIDAATGELTIDNEGGLSAVTLSAATPVTLTDTPKTFIFVVAPHTFDSGFSLIFTGSKEGKNYQFTHTTHNSATVTASKILNITKVFDIDITGETVEMEPGITYTADKEISINDNTFVPAALDSDYDEVTRTGRIYFEKGVEVTKVGANAFESTNLESIDLPETIEEIAAGAFKYCAHLTEIKNLDKVTKIGTLAFAGCSMLKDVALSPSLTELEDGTFKNCTALTSIDLSGVTKIGDTAFENCTALTSATINDTATSIGVGAFDGCSNLSSVNIPGGLTEMADHVFRNCVKLVEVDIPKNVTRIGYGAFGGCTELRTVNCKPMTPPNVYSDSFPTTSAEMVINVQVEALKQYQDNTEWNQFYGQFLRSAAL